SGPPASNFPTRCVGGEALMVNIRWAGSGFFCALFLLVLGTASCSRGRSDAELTGEAQSRISADRRMQTNGFCIQRALVVGVHPLERFKDRVGDRFFLVEIAVGPGNRC